MPIKTYRWQIATGRLAAVAGQTTGEGVRDALTRALTTQLADEVLVGDAMGAEPELLPLAPEGHASEVALKHQGLFVSLVQTGDADVHASHVTRDARPAAGAA